MNVAFIPVRGGSKSIPLKNIKFICNKPLVYWVVKAACECEHINKVYVATDSDKIRQIVEDFKNSSEGELFNNMSVIERSAESASDTASTEFAMLEFADKYEFDNIVLIQATSPLLTSKDLNKGFNVFNRDGIDSVLSAVLQKRFNWSVSNADMAYPINYDVYNRPRRQEFDGYYVENGAFYITSKDNLLKSKNRVSGNIGIAEMHEDTFFEIDEPSDWLIVESLMKKNVFSSDEHLNKNLHIKMFLTDCDGCLTDAGMYYSEFGDELKKFNTRDGMGFSCLKEAGIITGIVTSESVELNRRRADKLKLDILESGCKDKLSVIKKLCEKYGVSLSEVAYIGDDINDIDVIKAVGYGCCPKDAMPQVCKVADYVSNTKGGYGVIREVAEIVLGRKEEN